MWEKYIMMKENNKQTNKNKQQLKKVYKKPELLGLGDIRDVTMGGSFGSGDSGNPGAEKVPGL